MVKNDFFCYKITSSLILDFFSGSGTTAHALDLFLNNIKADRNDLDLLFGCMLDWGCSALSAYDPGGGGWQDSVCPQAFCSHQREWLHL